jgi:hypothetical protein
LLAFVPVAERIAIFHKFSFGIINMPIYEFYCKENNTLYSFLAKSLAYQNSVPRCPEDPQFSMEKKVSGFAFIGKAKDPTYANGMDDIDDAKMESVVAELGRDMAGFSEDNPDPKQMAHLMRRMSSPYWGKTAGRNGGDGPPSGNWGGSGEVGRGIRPLDGLYGRRLDVGEWRWWYPEPTSSIQGSKKGS